MHKFKKFNLTISQYSVSHQVKKLQSLGEKALVTHRHADALKCYNDAVEIEENNIDSLYGRANVFIKMGNYILAQHDADKVIMLDPMDFRVSKSSLSAGVYCKINMRALS